MTALPCVSLCVEVPFHDVDAMEVVWHGHYVKYLETARTQLLRELDYDYPQMRESGYLWPVVDCRLKYVRPARYGQTITVVARLVEYENRLKIDYEIFDASKTRLTRAHTVQVAVAAGAAALEFVSPPALCQRIEAWKVRQCNAG